MFDVKSLNSGATFVAWAGVIVPLGMFSVPSRWQVLQFALPRNRFQPASSFALNTCLVGLASA